MPYLYLLSIYLLCLILRLHIVHSETCSSGELLDKSKCKRCPEHCLFCDSDEHCLSCENEYWGAKCEKKCYNCKYGTSCEKTNGFCLDGCSDGLSGILCDTTCDGKCLSCNRTNAKHCLTCVYNRYSLSCDNICPSSCSNETCDDDTGVCTFGCKVGFWGTKCKSECPDHCVNKVCLRENGTCINRSFEAVPSYVIYVTVIVTLIGLIVVAIIGGVIYRTRQKRRAQNSPRFNKAESKNLLQQSSDKKIETGSEDASSNQPTNLHAKDQNTKTSFDFEMIAETELVSSHIEPVVGQTAAPGDQRKADRVKTKQSNKDQQSVGKKISKPMKIVKRMVGKPKTSEVADRGKSESWQQKIKDIAELLKTKTKDEAVIRKEFSVLPSENNDFNKVVVIGHDEKRYDINASYIKNRNKVIVFIACTAPTNAYYGWDFLFWRMVWQNRCSVIVMLNKLDENNTKLELYWPNKNKTENYGFLSVTCLGEYAKDTLSFVRTFEIKGENTEPIVVKQLQYLGWSESDAEENFRNLLEFRNIVNIAKQTNSGPTVVHSRKDTGRTGTYIALDLLLQSVDDMDDTVDETAVDIHLCVKHLRDQRVRMVDTVEQYKYLYNVLAYYIHSKAENEGGRDANKLSLKIHKQQRQYKNVSTA